MIFNKIADMIKNVEGSTYKMVCRYLELSTNGGYINSEQHDILYHYLQIQIHKTLNGDKGV